MRGARKIQQLSTTVFPEQTELFPQPETSLYNEKVKLMVARYYYFTQQQLKYEDILLKLQGEFFISTGRIADILNQQLPAIQEMRKEAPKPSWFRMQWAHLLW